MADPLFVIGNGTSDGARANALTVYKSGQLAIGGSANIARLQTNGGSILFAGDTGGVPASGHGRRMMWIPSLGAFRAGLSDTTTWDADSIGLWSFSVGALSTATNDATTAFGLASRAQGAYSIAGGAVSEALGDGSIALGYFAKAEGDFSVAMGGFGTHATGQASFAAGDLCHAVGDNSASFGQGNIARPQLATYFGRYADSSYTYSASSWVSTDPLFVIGNGAASNSRSNAVTVLKNGNVGIGMANPSDTFALQIAGDVKANGYNTSSDIRWKREILPLENSLNVVTRLRGRSYFMRVDEFPERKFDNRQHFGFIAQEVEQVIPELVATDPDGFKSMSYVELIPYLVEAIRAQNDSVRSALHRLTSIDRLEAENARLRLEAEQQRAAIDNLQQIILEVRERVENELKRPRLGEAR